MPNISSYAPSFRAANDINHEVKQPQNTTTPTNNDNKIGAKDIVLGSLATIGVLGMADVLLFKGKGINKLTGVAKKLKANEELKQKLKNAEELTAKTEERAVNAEKRAKEAEESYAERKEAAAYWEDEYDKLLRKKPQKLPLHEDYPNVIQWFQKVYESAQDFSKEEKDYLTKRIKNILYENYYDLKDSGKCNVFELAVDSDLKAPELNMPAIIHTKNGKKDKVVLPGKIFIPSFMEDIPKGDIRLLPNGNCLFRQKTDNGSIVKLIDTEGNKLKEIRFPKKESVK